ncbi:NAD(P)H-hydrate dehydratase [Methylosinus sporium]|uniref:Bifunctional NAD(P)H-hydrate repair enzyme n=1 Tax=Methylosinus sporium TaxID=428 RepID=A0A2U1SQV9_METSR|nr:NAD(P)H-hydrate dehydratase [Methylosinus sporium]PWB93996.1 bifunctional ADP-dependent NAD(P)H-hydrate dehydratase/NAD(P)H-hydrate epimerase [Methylosinus sporium]
MPLGPYPPELLTTAQMARADRLTIESGVAGMALMEKAAAAIAAAATAFLVKTAGRRVLVLCGPGNNGGDGYVAARILRSQRFKVRVAALTPPDTLHGDARLAATSWDGRVEDAATCDFKGVDLVIDALFGTGLARDLDGPTAELILRLNAWREETKQKIIAIDIPSGVDGTSGAIRGVAVQADSTVTFFRLKCGHLLLPGRLRCGTISCAHIGIRSNVLEKIQPQTFVNEPAAWRDALRLPSVEGHKYARGHAVVISGGASHTGAARLSALAALRGGAGLVTLATPQEAFAVNAPALTAVMLRVADGPAGLSALLEDKRKNVVALGPGLGVGEASCALVETALAPSPERRAVVLDADALTSFALAPDRLREAIRAAPGPVVLTPHGGEFARLFHGQRWERTISGAPISKLERTRDAARDIGAIVIFKGPDTVVAAPDGRASILAEASPWLATAGSGDVLTGIVAGLLAQGMEPFAAASCAVWMHAAAADDFGAGLIADDIIDRLPAAWRRLVSIQP